ncbi:ABC transporter substrate-binding protein [Cohnella abietis]|uniref:Ferrichrome ABC transporter substrate-binding protein n=1 Tax=Cohnella abietis TaxID=2507935 RepID=A0A3T1CYC2_9BACL|nr:ABC transporter substrate-binding protein [Cohnella abietis]BBI30828.1 ferrichrome ABC transporter substrate-binding protein [Cohnella abietis]
MNKRIIMVTALLLVLLSLTVACGKGNNESSTSSPAATESAQQEQPSSEAPKEAAAFKFTDTKGEQTLPAQPQNIATTVTYLTDHMIALGLTPKLTVKSQNEDFPLYLKPFLNNVEVIGEQGKVNIEKLLSFAPDLIITDTNSTEIFDSYAKIAPTAMLENGYLSPSWEEAFRATASAFGLNDKAEQVIGDYTKHKEEAIAKIHDKVAGSTLMVLRIRNDVRYYGDMDYRWLYDDFGFSRPAVFPVTSADNRYEVLSNEKLPEIDPDYILLIKDNEELFNSLQDLAIWKNLKAVKNNSVYQISSDSWFGGYGPNSANSMLDDLDRLFAN